MLNLTSQYALRAMIFIARHQDHQPILARRICEETGIPPKYLSKVLSDLVRARLLTSARGRGGGFALSRSPQDIRLIELVAPFESFDRHHCPFGNLWCDDADPCAAHRHWVKVLEAQQRFLRGVSLKEVSVRRRSGRSPKSRP